MTADFRGLYTSLRLSKSSEKQNPSNETRILAAVDWIKTAREASSDGGISKGYDLLRGKWAASYPETTGYTIPTLLNVAAVLDKPELQAVGLDLADYLLKCATTEGGVIHWQAKTQDQPIVFDTGQVIFGWLAAHKASNDDRYLQAARNASRWLVSIQDPSGSWKKGQFLGVEKVIDTRVAWALMSVYSHTQEDSFHQAALKNLDWALSRQNDAGWFADCAFRPQDDPFTHTLAYTGEGLLECSRLLDRSEFFEATRRMADALLSHQRGDGSLCSTYGSDWAETSRSSCLTGNCQMGRLWLRIYEITHEQQYLDAARKAIRFTVSTQILDKQQVALRGAIAGSSPVYGKYERFKYPNWAAKFFIDSLLELERITSGKGLLPFIG